jgi:plastocyanin
MQSFNIHVPLICLFPFASAQFRYGFSSETSSPSDRTSTPATSKNEFHIINVGKNGLAFEPNRLSVPVGDTVEFHFWPTTHSVAQSDFERPCTPRRGGMFGDVPEFYSGPTTVASGESPRVFRIQVNDTVSIFFYCAVDRHCQDGMAGVINE